MSSNLINYEISIGSGAPTMQGWTARGRGSARTRARARPVFRGHEIAEKRGQIRGRGRRAVTARGRARAEFNERAAKISTARGRADMILTARGRADIILTARGRAAEKYYQR